MISHRLKDSWKEGIFVISVIFYLSSLALPGIVYKPSLIGNPKAAHCNIAQSMNWECNFFPFNSRGMVGCGHGIDKVGKNPPPLIDKERIQRYCEGWDNPIVVIDYGYSILLVGWLGIFIGAFTPWFANVIGLVGTIFTICKKYKTALVLSLTAFGFGLNAFSFSVKTLDDSGTKLYVDYVGIGFYIWETSFLFLSLYCVSKLLDTKVTPT
jgi:hypothetical protein